MQIDTENEHIYATTYRPDGTCHTRIIRFATNPSEDERALADALRLADGLPKDGDPEAYFATACPPGSMGDAFRAKVLAEYRTEIEQRTQPWPGLDVGPQEPAP